MTKDNTYVINDDFVFTVNNYYELSKRKRERDCGYATFISRLILQN